MHRQYLQTPPQRTAKSTNRRLAGISRSLLFSKLLTISRTDSHSLAFNLYRQKTIRSIEAGTTPYHSVISTSKFTKAAQILAPSKIRKIRKAP